MSDSTPTLTPGDTLGPYRIDALMGQGGMGEVYRGTDTRLNRPVAVKVSAKQFSDRFEREARAISALNHPNICTLYDLGPNYLVMELVEGETLSNLIRKGPLPLEQSLQYAIQITDALAAAHAKGVIHRDLKPANIIVTKNGVKVLDFGLAKLSASAFASGSASATEAATLTEPITSNGTILGTLHYLSPEQAEGKEATERSDIFSFGAVFYEMVTGQRAFQGESQSGILAAILRDQPPSVTQVRPLAPRAIDRVIRKCLAKDPQDRWHSAHDLKPALELIDLDASAPAVATSSSGSHTAIDVSKIDAPKNGARWLWPAAGAVALIAIAGMGWTFWPKTETAGHVTRFEIRIPDGVFNPADFYIRVSPDGRKVAFTLAGQKGGIWLRELESLEARLLPGTAYAVAPIWSPDSRSLAYGVGSRLMKVDIAGGPPQILAEKKEGSVRSGFWSERGEIVFGPGIILRVPQSGGIPTPVTVRTKGEPTGHTLPFLLPDQRRFLYRRETDLYVGSLDAKPDQQSLDKIMSSPFGVEFVRDGNSEDGNLFFLRESTLLAQHFDTHTLKLTGDAVPIAQGVGGGPQHGHFSVTASGVLAYRTRGATERQLSWVDRQGKVLKQVGVPRDVLAIALAPDESQVALFRSDSGNLRQGDLWLLDLGREIETRFTFGQSASLSVQGSRPVWSRDSKRIAFRTSNSKLAMKPANGAGEVETLMERQVLPWDWSKDGRDVIYNDSSGLSGLRIGGSKGEPAKIVPSVQVGGVGGAALSPDNRWIAYTTLASGQPEVFVQPYNSPDEPSRAGGKYQVSRNGGGLPRWRADGKELFFVSGEGLMATQIEVTGDALQATAPVKLFDMNAGEEVLWDVSRDGQRFLRGTAATGANPPITVIENWRAVLKK